MPGPLQPASARAGPTRRRWLLVTLGFAVLYTALALLGRAVRLEGTQLALIWPAAAVGFLWLRSSWGTRRLPLDLGVMTGVVVAVYLVTGTGGWAAVLLAVASAVQAAVTCAVLYGNSCPVRRLDSTSDLGRLVLACAAGSLAGTPLAAVPLWLMSDVGLGAVAVTWSVRNAVGTFVFSIFFLRLPHLAARGARRSRARRLEGVLAGAVLGSAYTVVFSHDVTAPLAAVLPLSMWLALRFSTTTAVAHVPLVGVLVVLATLDGHGPFAVADPLPSLLVAQAFIAVLGLVTSMLALQRDERVLLFDWLASAHGDVNAQAVLLDSVLATIDVGVVACDADGHLTMFNRATREMHGVAEDPAVGPDQWADRFDLFEADGSTPLTRDRIPLVRALVDGQVHDAIITIAPRDRAALTVRCDGRTLVAPDGTVLGAVVAMKDITEIRASEQRFRDAFEHGPTPMARLGAGGRIEQVNPALRRLLSRPSSQLLGRSWTELAHEEDRARLERTGDVDEASGLLQEARFLRVGGAPVWCEIAVTAGSARDGQRYSFVQLLDVTARKQQELALEAVARHDALTGLPNRHLLSLRLAELLDPDSGPGAALLVLDLDGFKAVNDRHGHGAGDAVLVAVGERLTAALRPGDTAVRLGGDEFVVVLPLPDGRAGAHVQGLSARLRRALTEPIPWDGRLLTVGVSIGMSLAPPGTDPDTALATADAAMYAQKKQLVVG